MRLINFLVMIFAVTSIQALEPSLCGGDTIKVTQINGTSLIMCDCQCTNEENIFYIRPKNLRATYKVEASRLVSQNIISKASSKVFCDDKVSLKSHFVFTTKVPSRDGEVCFETSLVGLDKEGLLNRGKLEVFDFSRFLRQQIVMSKAYLYDNGDAVISDNLKTDFYKFMNTQVSQRFKPVKTKMYLIKGDKVTLLDEKTDDSNQKWYLINYKGKKDLNMWIKAEAVDLEPEAVTNQKQEKEEPKQIEKAAPKEPEPAAQTKLEPPKPTKVTKQTLDTTPPKKPETSQTKPTEKAEPTKTATGSISLAFLTSMLGLLALRLS